jgi:hypothetical protein
MKKWIGILLIILSYSLDTKSQVLTQTYLDPCDSKMYVVSFPLPISVITVAIRNKAKSFTYIDAQNGTMSQWIVGILSTPCPVPVAAVVTQTQVATSVARSAATVAATAAAAPPPVVVPTAAPAPAAAPASAPAASSSSTSSSSSSSSSESSSSSSSSSESKSESSSSEESKTEESSSEESSSEESKSEEKEEEKKESKNKGAKQQRINPLLIASDLTTAQNPDNTFSAIMNVGVSKNSMAGDVSYGVTGMVWSNLNQFAVSSRYTKITFNDAMATTVANTSLTTAYAMGSVFVFLGYSEVISKPKLGVLGYNVNLGAMFLTGGIQSYLSSLTMFYMKPVVLTKRIIITPSMFASGTPLLYSQSQTSVDTNLALMAGSTFDYAITKKFKFGFDYKISFGTAPNIPILNMVMVGSKIQL